MHEHSLTSAALTCQVAASCFSKPTALLLLCSLQAVQVLQQTGHTLMSGSALQDSRGTNKCSKRRHKSGPSKKQLLLAMQAGCSQPQGGPTQSRSQRRSDTSQQS